jgi:putative hydroxymethylpyrimidine transport system substrate-binding protein
MKTALSKPGCWLLAVAILIFAGCGGGERVAETRPPGAGAAAPSQQGLREAWISVDGYKGAQSVGILMAQKLGYFEDAGVELYFTSAISPDWPVKYVREGMVDFAVLRQPQVALAEEKGAPIIAVGALEARPTTALIWLEGSGIDGIADLRGRTIAIPGSFFEEDALRSLLQRHGVTLDQVKVKHVRYDLTPALVRGQADAIFGGSWNVEGVALAARGLKPVVHRVQRLGFPRYDEQVLVARTGWASQNGSLIRDVMTALARGTAAAVAHPEAAVRAIEEGGESDPSVTPEVRRAEVEATLPLLSRTGYMSPGQAEELIDWMHAQGWIKRAYPGSRLITDEYLPTARTPMARAAAP